jgi:hypothetical protein
LREDEFARVCIAWARCVSARTGIDDALRVLSEARSATPVDDLRRELDLGAARLIESTGDFSRAAEAYRDNY